MSKGRCKYIQTGHTGLHARTPYCEEWEPEAAQSTVPAPPKCPVCQGCGLQDEMAMIRCTCCNGTGKAPAPPSEKCPDTHHCLNCGSYIRSVKRSVHAHMIVNMIPGWQSVPDECTDPWHDSGESSKTERIQKSLDALNAPSSIKLTKEEWKEICETGDSGGESSPVAPLDDALVREARIAYTIYSSDHTDSRPIAHMIADFARARAQKLESALLKYGRHATTCNRWTAVTLRGDSKCDCGWKELLAALSSPEPTKEQP